MVQLKPVKGKMEARKTNQQAVHFFFGDNTEKTHGVNISNNLCVFNGQWQHTMLLRDEKKPNASIVIMILMMLWNMFYYCLLLILCEYDLKALYNASSDIKTRIHLIMTFGSPQNHQNRISDDNKGYKVCVLFWFLFAYFDQWTCIE